MLPLIGRGRERACTCRLRPDVSGARLGKPKEYGPNAEGIKKRVANDEDQPISRGVQDEPHLVGERAAGASLNPAREFRSIKSLPFRATAL